MPRRTKPDAVTLIKEDHRKVEKLFESFEKARDEDRKKALAREICTALTIHAMIEEEIFYPACQGKIEDEDVLDEAYVEHDGAKVLISEIMSNINARFFEAKVTVLSEMIKHHVKEEEKRSEGLLAQARTAGLDMDALAERLMARKEELMQQFADGHLPPAHTRSYTGAQSRSRQTAARARRLTAGGDRTRRLQPCCRRAQQAGISAALGRRSFATHDARPPRREGRWSPPPRACARVPPCRRPAAAAARAKALRLCRWFARDL